MVGDAELAVAAAGGDREALADIYDRYANTLHELCRVILGETHQADDALHDTFVTAATRLSGLRDAERLKPWLCAVARRESIRRARRRPPRRGRDAVLHVPEAEHLLDGVGIVDTDALVWDSVGALGERERLVVELGVRQRLEGPDLALASGLPGATAADLLARVGPELAAGVRCNLLVRSGREDCAELRSITPRRHATIDATMRKRVTRHATRCSVCGPKWHTAPDALGVFAAAPPLGAPVELRHEVLHDPRLIASVRPLPEPGWQRDGFPPSAAAPRRRPAFVAAAAVVPLLVAIGLVLASSDDAPQLPVPRTGATTTVTHDVEDFAPYPTDPKNDPTTTTRAPATTTTTRKPGPTTTRAPGAVPPATTAPPPPPPSTTAPPMSISASARDNTLACGTGTTGVSATTSGPPPNGLFLHWSASSEAGSKGMSGSGSSWSATLGPFSNPGTVTWWVSTAAIGNGGTRSSSHTIDVTRPC